MNEEKKQEITRLALAANSASEHHRALSMQNTLGIFEDREKQAVAYALAAAELVEAQAALSAAIHQTPSTP